MRRVSFIVFAISAVLLSFSGLDSCKKKDIGTPADNEIFLLYKAFNPTQLAVKKGTTVKFTNKDNANHTATANSGLFNSGKLQTDDSFTYTFDTPGTYYFYCNYHSSNTQEQGVIIVQ